MATLGLLNAKAEPATCNAPAPAQAVIEGAVAEGERCSTIPSSTKGGQSSSREHKARGAELYRQANNVIHRLMFELQINFIGNVQKSLILTKEQVTKLVIDWDIVDRLPMLKEQNSLQNIALELDASARNKADENAMKLAEDLKRLNEELHTRIVYLAWLKGDFECCQILIDKWEWETNKEQFMELAEDMKRQNEEFDNRIVEMERLKGIFECWLLEIDETKGGLSIAEDKVEIQRQRIMEADENALKLAFTFKGYHIFPCRSSIGLIVDMQAEELHNRVVEVERLKGIAEQELETTKERLSIAEDELEIQRQRTMEANENAMKLAQDLKRQNEELRNRVVEAEQLKGSAERKLETTKGHLSVAEGKVQHIMEQSLGYCQEFGMHALSAVQLVHGPLDLSMMNFGLIKELPEGFDPICPDGVAIERWKQTINMDEVINVTLGPVVDAADVTALGHEEEYKQCKEKGATRLSCSRSPSAKRSSHQHLGCKDKLHAEGARSSKKCLRKW
ncbi:hypothetical protein ES332_D10G193200v1 [Gossypium tomentosum]|uniref:Uncharacterized protein n=3 Tax=Gossypium tomentosum TaxID=34277 RepID=A0A5D2J879_GOSTO|nr:hypothetical protein ES332_D10G193200v1 [Gossypium tomentosum]